MRKTIQEEMKVHFLKEVLIHANALLIYRQNTKRKDQVDICVRFIENDTIRDQHLITIPKEKMADSLIEINQEGTAIATYQEVGGAYQLDRVYSLTDHTFSTPDFKQYEYQQWFKKSPQFVKKRGTEDGKR